MKPCDMLVLRDPERGVRGDCLRACVASIFELDSATLPHFAQDDLWPVAWIDWLDANGLQQRNHPRDEPPKGYSIAVGDGGRGCKHGCVALDGQVVHDPHPSRACLLSIDYYMTLDAAQRSAKVGEGES